MSQYKWCTQRNCQHSWVTIVHHDNCDWSWWFWLSSLILSSPLLSCVDPTNLLPPRDSPLFSLTTTFWPTLSSRYMTISILLSMTTNAELLLSVGSFNSRTFCQHQSRTWSHNLLLWLCFWFFFDSSGIIYRRVCCVSILELDAPSLQVLLLLLLVVLLLLCRCCCYCRICWRGCSPWPHAVLLLSLGSFNSSRLNTIKHESVKSSSALSIQ